MDEDHIVIAQTRIMRAFIRALGMQAENMQRQYLGQSMAYQEDSFISIVGEEGLNEESIRNLIGW
jgi:hypothetical protein